MLHEHNRYPVTTIVGGQFSLFMVENLAVKTWV